MLLNLPYHIREFIQLGNKIIELVAISTSYFPSTLELLELNLKPQKMNEITNFIGYGSYCDIRTINCASLKGCIHILEWWKNSKLSLNYTELAIDNASFSGHINVLEWWKNSELELKYDKFGIDIMGYLKCHVSVLEWWKKSGLELKYSENAIINSCKWGNVEILEWWKNSKLPLKYDESAINEASHYCHVSVLEWWKNSGLELKYDKTDQKLVEFFNK